MALSHRSLCIFLLFYVVANAQISLYYHTQWKPAYVHFSCHGSSWTEVPGHIMSPSPNPKYPAREGWWHSLVCDDVTFALNDGKGHWDNNYGRNYHIAQPGSYTLKDGRIEQIEESCPRPHGQLCSDHGSCRHGLCHCTHGYAGFACQLECPGGHFTPCSGHGQCTPAGHCKCDPGWTGCNGSKSCDFDILTSSRHCGGCHKECLPDARRGILTAKCQNGHCHRTCDTMRGFLLCPDGKCHYGTKCPVEPLPGCEIYHENQCQGDVIITASKYKDNRWQTPKRGGEHYQGSFQDMSEMVGHVQLIYASDRRSAIARVHIITCDPSIQSNLVYYFDGLPQREPSKRFDVGFTKSLRVHVEGPGPIGLSLPEVDFMWNTHTPLKSRPGDYRNGQKGAIVELFGWPHTEVAKECGVIGKMGYLGVKLFPAQEQIMQHNAPFQHNLNPWFFMYQPVSYNLNGRMGTRDQLRKTIAICRSHGVRVYADAVINHMSASGNDGDWYHRNPGAGCSHWGEKNTSAPRGQESPFFNQGFKYRVNGNTGKAPLQEYPAVPYGPLDFHCERTLSSWTSPLDLNAGWLVGLTDLNTERENVQQRIADYLTDLLSVGFSGFRIDAAKHIHPHSLVAIFARLKRNLGGNLPEDFFLWMEVLLGGEAQMLMCNEFSGYNYGRDMVKEMRRLGFSGEEIGKLKIWDSGYPKEPFADCHANSPHRKVIQNDDHDQQSPGPQSRDMGNQGSVLIKDKNVDKHRSFEMKLFSNPNGVADNDNDNPIRCVLSSFYWEEGSLGIPDGQSDCSTCHHPACRTDCRTTHFKPAHNPHSCGYDSEPDYTRVHRDRQIVQAMRKWMHLSTGDNVDLGLPGHC